MNNLKLNNFMTLMQVSEYTMLHKERIRQLIKMNRLTAVYPFKIDDKSKGFQFVLCDEKLSDALVSAKIKARIKKKDATYNPLILAKSKFSFII